jgi:hypothetical protein
VIAAKERRSGILQHVELAKKAGERAPEQRDDLEAESFEVAQLVEGSRSGEAITAMSARFAARGDTLGAIIREQQDKTAFRPKLNAALIKAVGSLNAQRNQAAETELRSEFDETERRLAALEKTIEVNFRIFPPWQTPNR